ncbi:hypothetical protein SAMN05216390_10569 [Lachnospiraceae bacterium KH1T2]|nr:hypothetical protein SAMN05216390_10569 [Lachnospiraceae bacterium KH1T2]
MRIAEGEKQLNIIQVVYDNESYSEVVVETAGSFSGEYRLVWVIREHEMASALVRILARSECCRIFSSGGNTCFSFPYEEQRPIERFYYKTSFNRDEKDMILRALVILCMTSDIPCTLLYLMLSQRQIMLEKDKSMHLSYMLVLERDIKEYKETDCVRECARLLIDLLDTDDSNDKAGRKLLLKRYERNGYSKWIDLYRDVKLITAKVKRKKFRDLVRELLSGKKEFFVRLLFTVCIVLAVVTLFMIISQVLLGRIPLFNLFTKSFDVIGTESLKQ